MFMYTYDGILSYTDCKINLSNAYLFVVNFYFTSSKFV